MRSLASSDFFREIYSHLGGLVTAAALRSLAWMPLLVWLSRAETGGASAGSYGLGALGFLVIALMADPFLSGGALELASRIVGGRPASPKEAIAGLGTRYRALLAWTWIQALVAFLAGFNLLQFLTPESAVPAFLGVLSSALALWAWLLLRAMNIHLPSMLIRENFTLREALLGSFLLVIRQPGGSLALLIFRFGLSILLIISGIGVLLGLGSFGVLHGFGLRDTAVR